MAGAAASSSSSSSPSSSASSSSSRAVGMTAFGAGHHHRLPCIMHQLHKAERDCVGIGLNDVQDTYGYTFFHSWLQVVMSLEPLWRKEVEETQHATSSRVSAAVLGASVPLRAN